MPIYVFYNIIFCLFQTLPDQSHCYFLSDHDSLNGYVVKKIPFSHPAQVPRILATLKKQAVFNSILSSCIRASGIQGNFETVKNSFLVPPFHFSYVNFPVTSLCLSIVSLITFSHFFQVFIFYHIDFIYIIYLKYL